MTYTLLHKQNNTKHFLHIVSSVFVTTHPSQVPKLQLIFSYATLALQKQVKSKRIDKAEINNKGGKLRDKPIQETKQERGSNKAICRKSINLSANGTCYHTTDSYPCTSGTFTVLNI